MVSARARRVLLAAILSSTVASERAHADPPFYVFIDDDGVVHVRDEKPDARFRAYQPGSDFEAFALRQEAAPHAGTRARRPVPSRFDGIIDRAAERYGVRPALARAVVAVESAFDPRAVSHAGAQGLMQLMPATARELGVENAFDPAENVDGGTRYLAGLLRMFDDERLAVAAYNCGPSRVRAKNDVPAIAETRAYVKAVLALADAYEETLPLDEAGGERGDGR